MKKLFPLCLSVLIGFTACDEDPEGMTSAPPAARKAIIGVEGIVPNGISSLGEYDIVNQTLNNNVYRKANLTTMGSGLSDLYADHEAGLLFAVMPASEKVAVCDLKTYELQQVIEVTDQARKIIRATPEKYYMTSWENNEVVVLGPNRFRVINRFEAGNKPDKMLLFEDLVFISNTGTFEIDSTITIVRATADTLIATLQVGVNPNGMAIDYENNMLYVLCAGKENAQNPIQSGIGSLWKYNLDSMRTAIDSGNTLQFDTVLYFNDNQLRPQHLVVDEEGGFLYYIDNFPTGNIMRMTTTARRVSETPAIMGNFYQLGFDQTEDELYGFNTPGSIDATGSVQIFTPGGALKVSHKIGSRPREVEFK